MTKHGDVQYQRQPVRKLENSILHGLNSLFTGIKQGADEPGQHIDDSSKGCSIQLNGLFLNCGVRGRHEGKDCHVVDMISLIIGVYINRPTGFKNCASMTAVYRIYYDTMLQVVSQNYGRGLRVTEMETLRRDS